MHSPARRAAKALAGLVVAAGLVLAAAPPGRAASTGEGATVKQILSEKLPNVPGKTLTVVEVDYRPGGFSAPHRHPASGFRLRVCPIRQHPLPGRGRAPPRLQRRP